MSARITGSAYSIARSWLVSALAFAMSAAAPVPAFAEGQYMENLDVERLFDQNGNVAENSLAVGLTSILRAVVTRFLLPIGIFLSIWRSAYIAIFCVMAHTDPLHVVNEKNLSFVKEATGSSQKARRANRMQKFNEYGAGGATWGDLESIDAEIGIKALKEELRKSARSLVVVFAMWTFLQIIATIVYWFFLVIGG